MTFVGRDGHPVPGPGGFRPTRGAPRVEDMDGVSADSPAKELSRQAARPVDNGSLRGKAAASTCHMSHSSACTCDRSPQQ
eukprot:7294068-Alexandrium_andersonii.AAC.1